MNANMLTGLIHHCHYINRQFLLKPQQLPMSTTILIQTPLLKPNNKNWWFQISVNCKSNLFCLVIQNTVYNMYKSYSNTIYNNNNWTFNTLDWGLLSTCSHSVPLSLSCFHPFTDLNTNNYTQGTGITLLYSFIIVNTCAHTLTCAQILSVESIAIEINKK